MPSMKWIAATEGCSYFPAAHVSFVAMKCMRAAVGESKGLQSVVPSHLCRSPSMRAQFVGPFVTADECYDGWREGWFVRCYLTDIVGNVFGFRLHACSGWHGTLFEESPSRLRNRSASFQVG